MKLGKSITFHLSTDLKEMVVDGNNVLVGNITVNGNPVVIIMTKESHKGINFGK